MAASFGISTTRSGKVIQKVAGTDWTEGLVCRVQSDGKIIVAGTMNFNPNIATTPWDPTDGSTGPFGDQGRFLPVISRYNSDGSPDVSFGVGGFAFLDFLASPDHFDAEITDVKVLASGKILVGFIYFELSVASKDGIARLNANGTLDPTFGSNGVLLRGQPAIGYVDVLRIGTLSDGSLIWATSVVVPTRWMVCFKYDADGQAGVAAFSNTGTNGSYIYADPDSHDTRLTSLHIAADDSIYLGGQWGAEQTAQKFIVVKIDGTTADEDTNFGTAGVAYADFAQHKTAWPLAQFLESGTRLILGGFAAYDSSDHVALAMACFNKSTGVLDNTFGTSGLVNTHGGPQNNDQSFGRLFFDANGKIVMAGQSCSDGSAYYSATQTFLLARYSANGVPDATFGTGGFLTIDIDGSGNQDTYGGGLAGDGGYLFSGHVSGEDWVGGAGGAKGYLMRTSSAGVPDTAFGQLDGFAYGTAPEVTTDAASAVAATTTTANATIDPNGSPTWWRFVYGKTSGRYAYRTDAALVGAGSSGVAVTASLTGLTSGTAYYGRAIAYSGKGGHAVGAEVTWTTS